MPDKDATGQSIFACRLTERVGGELRRAWKGRVVSSLLMTIAMMVLPSSRGDDAVGVADGTLRACALLSIDRAIAVGDRGLILRTDDGGKRWQIGGARSEFNYHAIGFETPLGLEPSTSGLIVGGTIDPISGRSVGVVEITNDDGKTWVRSNIPGLARLTGLQRVGHRHWIAWGDWSEHWQSGIMESLDGGRSWSARPTPCSHVRCAAVDDRGAMILVDRAGNAFRSNDGMEFQPLSFGLNPFEPIRCCKRTEQGWWLGGDHGQLYFSENSVDWKRLTLPGNDSDHALISIRDIAAHGSDVWLVGEPGIVGWHSRDRGQSWTVASTQYAMVLHSVHSLDENLLMACGAHGRILVSRNGGRAWLPVHRSGDRVACMSIASVQRDLPWDFLAYITYEGKRRAAAVVIHDQHFHQSAGDRPEMSERIATVASALRIEGIQTLPEFPIGDLREGIRATDLAYYRSPEASNSELIRRLILQIRCCRPDLLVCEDSMSKQSLAAASAVATQNAVQLAASPSFRLFSPESGIEIPEWTVQRIMARSAEPGGLTLAPTMLLNNSGRVLSDVMRPARYLSLSESAAEKVVGDVSNQRITYRLSSQRTTAIKQPLDSLVLDSSTLLRDTQEVKTKVASLLATSNAPSRVTQLLKTRGSGLLLENAWDDALREFASQLPQEVLLDSLWTIAVDSRRNGNWHRWHTALNMILERSPESSMAELAYHELMTCFGSPEIQRIVQDQWTTMQSTNHESVDSKTGMPGNNTSPFAARVGEVALASHETSSRVTPIAKFRGSESFSRLLGRWPDAWQPRRTEPEWAWLIASRFRSKEMLRDPKWESSSQTVFWPAAHLDGRPWSQIMRQEQAVLAMGPDSQSVPFLPFVSERPYLDGLAQDPVWQQALTLRLESQWSEDTTEAAEIRIARDGEFLFLHCRAPRRPNAIANSHRHEKKPKTHPSKKRDSLDASTDHVRLRLDLDRDYATWFEFAWDCQGETLDQCNDMPWWNPTWFVAFDVQPDAWSTEIAIPLASLLPDPSLPNKDSAYSPEQREDVATASDPPITKDLGAIDWGNQVWGVSIVRERPSESIESITPLASDRWSRDQWLLISSKSELPVQPEELAQPSSSSPSFRDASR